MGYARDFPGIVEVILEDLVANDVTLLSNAGGVNPEACQERILDIAAVAGDDVLREVPALREAGVSFENADTGEPFEEIADRLVAANAYLGAFPLAAALDDGADIVVTGRCVDAATVMAPLIHEFGWGPEEYDRLASGLIAGHLLECGTQVTGGNLSTGWQDVDFHEMGYPIAEIGADGDFVVTKPDGTGGKVTERTVSEQLVYEIKDPERYMVPDVTADFTTPDVEAVGPDRVAVTGCEGGTPPETLKVTALYEDGYKAQLLLVYSWPDALEKARTADEIVRRRVEEADLDLDEIRTEFLGYNGCHDGIAVEPTDPNEIVLRMAVHADEKEPIREFNRRALPVSVSGPPTVAPVVSGRPDVNSVLSFWPCTIPREHVQPDVTVTRSGGE